MIRIFKLVLLLVVSQVAFGQAPSNYTNINGRYRWIAGMFDSTFHIPKGTSASLRTGGSTNAGALFYNTTDSSVYTYTGTQWIKLRGVVIDTTSLSNRINLKLNISDTASMLNPYLRKIDTTNKFVTQVYKKNASDSVFYVKGGNHIWAFNDSTGSAGGGGGGKIYYFNGGVSMGTIGGLQMYELGDTANTGAAANFTRATTGNIANFITDPGKPGLVQIPAGVWSVDAWLSETGGGANHAEIWIEVEKWDGSTITTIATSPIEQITEGSTPNLYSWSVSIPTTSLTVTDRIIIQFYISNTNGKTVTLYTQNGYVGEVHTTFTTGIGAINGLTAPAQYLVTGTSGTDFNINSATATHTFNLPTASATNRGALSTTDWTTFNSKLSPADTVSLSNRINLKLNISDTAAMLSPYARTNVVNAGLATKVNISDTATMLSPYARKNFLNAGTGISYSSSTGTIANTAPDQTVALSAGTGISISGTYPNFTITNSSPSSGGTVTSVGSNNGTGLTGGPITTSGTLAIDTLLISTRGWRQKGIDSVQANLTAGLATKLNISDTASMLSPYARTNVVNAGLALKVNISDTASMLTPYLRKIDTTSMLSPYLRSNVAAATYVPQTRTITINGTSQDLTANRTYNVGTVTSVGITAGTGISVANSPVTGSGNITVTNTAPDQTVSLSAGTGISIAGTYPSFTITNSSPSSGGTVTSVGSNSGTGLTGGPITGSGTLAIDTALISTRLWRQKGVDSVAALANTKVSSVSGTAPISSSGGTSPTISISQASGSTDGFLSSTDWTTFNNKQNALTNPVTGTGTTNYVTKWTSSSAIGNSQIIDNGTNVLIGTNSDAGYKLQVNGSFRVEGNSLFNGSILSNSTITGSSIIKSGGTSSQYLMADGSTSTLTNPVTGTGTTNYLPKFTSSSAIGNSSITDDGTVVKITSNTAGNATLNLISTNNANSGKIQLGGGTFGATIEKNSLGANTSLIFNSYHGGAEGYIFQSNGTNVMTLNASGNLGLGVTPSAWGSQVTALQLPQAVSLYAWNASAVPQLYLGANNYFDGSNFKYTITGQAATLYYQASGQHIWYNAPSGTAGNNISLTQAMTLTSGGLLGIGATNPTRSLQITRTSTAFINAEGSIVAMGSSDTELRLFGNNTETMTLKSGNVGIGTTSPVTNLQVHKTTTGLSGVQVTNSTTGSTIIDGTFFGIDDTQAYVWNYENTPYIFATNNTERMRITSGGNVGIGTSSAARRLDVASDGSNWISGIFAGSGGTDKVVIGNLSGAPSIGGHNSTLSSWARLALNPDGGNVLVGTSTDDGSTKFQVNGAIKTAAPSGGTAAAWKLGSVVGKRIEVDVAGTGYTIPLAGLYNLDTKSANYTLTSSDYTVGFDCASDRTATLPDATTSKGRVYVIYQYNTGSATRGVTIDPNGAQTIDGNATAVLTGWCDFTSVMIQSDGSNWVIISDSLKGGCN